MEVGIETSVPAKLWCDNQGTKSQFFWPIFRRFIGFRWEWIEICMEENRLKITVFSIKIGKSRYFGDLSVIFLDNFLPLDFFLVLIKRSRFRLPFLKNPTAIFVILWLILNLKLVLMV